MARSLHESKQKIHCTRTKRSLESANRLKQQSRKPQPNKKRRPANPPARLAFRQRKKRSKQQKPKHNPKNGARTQTKTPTESICHWTQWHDHCITIKNMQNELGITAVQADMKTSLGVNPSMSQAVHESRATMKPLSESSQINSSWAFMDIIVILLTVSRDHEAMV